MRTKLSVALVALAACGTDRPSETADYVARDSSGVRIVESYVPGWGVATRSADTEPVLQIGGVSGETPYLFGSIPDLELLPNGWIAVAESQANELRFFSSEGEHVATFGGAGAGPDEFRGIGSVHRYRGDSIAVFDFGLSRTLVVPIPPGPGRAVSGLIDDTRSPVRGVFSDGSIVATHPIPAARQSPATVAWDTTAIFVSDPSGESVREIRRLPYRLRSRGPVDEQMILAPGSILAVGDERVYWARTDRYQIHVFGASGALVALWRRPIEPKPLTDSDREVYSDSTIARLRRLRGADVAQRYERIFRVAPVGDARPLFWRAFVDRNRRLWVSEWPWPARFAAPRRWTVFSPEGVWLGDVEAPPDFLIHDADDDLLLGEWTDGVGVPYVRLHRLSEIG